PERAHARGVPRRGSGGAGRPGVPAERRAIAGGDGRAARAGSRCRVAGAACSRGAAAVGCAV
ncbi:MAG: hypothetical protein AVDCRST_MAG19-2821, partial [uncultured Thermomicrobiales bacterium]